MKKICFIIPDGIGIKNYLYSELVEYLQHKNCEIILLHSVSIEAIEEINKVHKTKFKSYKIPFYRESYFQKFLRESICYARLLNNTKITGNVTILTNWKPNKSSLIKKIFYRIVEIVGKYISKEYKRILKFEEKYNTTLLKNCENQKILLKSINPDIIFSTHQRAINVVPLIIAAKQLNIRTVGAIFSWDNLPKARLTVRTEKYMMWSEYMKKELNLYYPEIKNECISITGTPQFEFYYNNKFILDKKVFYNKYKLDVSKKIICFSGDDQLTSPFDPVYLGDIAKTIKDKELNIQILLRRSPADVSGRFEKVLKKYPNIIKNVPPLWNFDKKNKNNWQVIYPKFDDIKLLVSTVYYSDFVINLGSTMAHDFSVYNKPTFYLNYNPVDSDYWDVKTIYKFQHFRSMKGLDVVGWINNKSEIGSKLIDGIEKTDSIGKDKKEWFNIIANYQNSSTLKLAEILAKN